MITVLATIPNPPLKPLKPSQITPLRSVSLFLHRAIVSVLTIKNVSHMEHKLRAQFVRKYRNESGNNRYVYMLIGNQESIEQYLQDKEDEGYPAINPDTNEPEPIFNSGRFIPNNSEVVRSDKGKWYPDTFELDALNDLKAQFPNLDDETLRGMISAKPVATTKSEVQDVEDEDLDV